MRTYAITTLAGASFAAGLALYLADEFHMRPICLAMPHAGHNQSALKP